MVPNRSGQGVSSKVKLTPSARADRTPVATSFRRRLSSEKPCRPSSVVSVFVCWPVVADAYPWPFYRHDLPCVLPSNANELPRRHGNGFLNRTRLRRRSTSTPHCPNAPHDRCQRENTRVSLPYTTTLALAIGNRGSTDGDIDHGLGHLRPGRKSRRRAPLPLPRDHQRRVNGGHLCCVGSRHTVPFCDAHMTLHLKNRTGCSRMNTGTLVQRTIHVMCASEQTQPGNRDMLLATARDLGYVLQNWLAQLDACDSATA